MTNKKKTTGKEGAAKAAPVPVVRFEFKNGPARITLAEHERQILLQAGRMASSDSVELRIAGEKLLAEHSQKSAAATVAALKKDALRPKQSRAGKASGIARAPAWHTDVIKAGREMVAAGTVPPRNVAAILARRAKFAAHSPDTIRRVLRKADVI